MPRDLSELRREDLLLTTQGNLAAAGVLCWNASDYERDGYVYVHMRDWEGVVIEPAAAARQLVSEQLLDAPWLSHMTVDLQRLRVLNWAIEGMARHMWPGCSVMLLGPEEVNE